LAERGFARARPQDFFDFVHETFVTFSCEHRDGNIMRSQVDKIVTAQLALLGTPRKGKKRSTHPSPTTSDSSTSPSPTKGKSKSQLKNGRRRKAKKDKAAALAAAALALAPGVTPPPATCSARLETAKRDDCSTDQGRQGQALRQDRCVDASA
jgi:hypothetical protein